MANSIIDVRRIGMSAVKTLQTLGVSLINMGEIWLNAVQDAGYNDQYPNARQLDE